MHTKQSTISGNYRKLKRKQFWLLETHGKWNTILRMAQTRTIKKQKPHTYTQSQNGVWRQLQQLIFQIILNLPKTA